MADQLEQTILNLLVPDSNIINEATSKLKQFMKSPEAVPALCQLLSSSSKTEVRQYAAVLLRRKLLKQKHWNALPVEICESIRQELLNVLAREPDHNVRKSVAQLVAAISKHDLPGGKWPNLFNFLEVLIKSADLAHKEAGMFLLSSVASVAHKELKPQITALINLCSAGLGEVGNHMIPYYSIRTLMHLMNSLESDHAIVFQGLVPRIFEVVRSLIVVDQDLAVECMGLFDDLIGCEIPILAPHLKLTLPFFIEVGKNQMLKPALRNAALSLLCDILEKKKKAIVKMNVVAPLVTELFAVMCEEEKEEDEDEEENSVPSMASQVFNAMSLHLPPEKYITPLLKHIEPAFENPNPRIRAGAFMAIGVSTEGCSENIRNKHMKKLLAKIYKGMTDENERVKSAAMYALAEFSEFLQPNINKYSQELLPLLFDCLGKLSTNSDAQRADLARIYYAIETFCENLGKDIIPYLPQLMEFLISSAQNNPSYDVKELSISTIGAAAESANEELIPYLPRILELLKQHLAPTEEEGPLKVQIQSLETLAILLAKAGEQNEALAMECFTMALGLIDDSSDPDLRGAVYRLLGSCTMVLKDKVATHVPMIANMMITCMKSAEGISATFHDDDTQHVSEIFNDDEEDEVEIGGANDDDDDGYSSNVKSISLHNAYMNEKVDALIALGEVASGAGLSFLPLFEASFKECLDLLMYIDPSVVKAAAFCATDLCCAAHNLSKECPDLRESIMTGLNTMLSSTVPKMLEVVREELDREVVISVLEYIYKMLSTIGAPVVQAAGSHVIFFNLIKDVLKKKIKCQDEEMDDDSDDEAEYDSLLIENAGELIPALAEIAPNNDFIAFYNGMIPELMKKLKKSSTTADKSFALGNMAETMNKLGPAGGVFALKLYPSMVAGVRDEDEEVRNNAIYGLGVLAENGGTPILNHYNEILKILSETMSKESDRRVIDNICGAVCRMISANQSAVPISQVLPTVVNHLPLQVDLEEHPTVFLCFESLYAQKHADFMPLLPKVLSVSGSLLNDKLKPGFKTQLSMFVHEVFKSSPETFQGVTDEQAIKALQLCLQH